MLRSLSIRLTLRFIAIVALCFLISLFIAILGGSTSLPTITIKSIGAALSIAALFWLCHLDRRSLENAGLRVPNVLKSLLLGLVVGLSLYTLIILAATFTGLYKAEAITLNSTALIGSFTILTVAAVYEEILFRGILLQGLESGFGSWLALFISSILFGLLHASNAGATLTSTLNVALAGVAFGLALLKYRNLWLLSGIHLGWNFSQGPIYGVAVSGIEFSSLIQSTQQGPILFTGGVFGFEASLLTLVLTISVSLCLLYKLKTIAPLWARKKDSST